MIELKRIGSVDGRIPAQDKLKISWDIVDRTKRNISICLVLCVMMSAHLQEKKRLLIISSIHIKASCLNVVGRFACFGDLVGTTSWDLISPWWFKCANWHEISGEGQANCDTWPIGQWVNVPSL